MGNREGFKIRMNQKQKKEDFNSLFWKIWGVNNRVFEILDIFTIKSNGIDEKETKEYKNLNRDKQSDYKNYENFLKNDSLLSNEKYLEHVTIEVEIFFIFFIKYLPDNSRQVDFYVSQLNNIAINYKIFKQQKFDKEMFINLFAFQIALIIENMKCYNIDTLMFDKALEDNSIMPFFDKYREIKDGNNKIKKMKQKDLAIELSYINFELKEKFQKSKIYLEEVSADSFNKEISKWKNNKAFPSLAKIFVIINTIQKVNNNEKVGKLFQLLIVRALLYIQKEFEVEEYSKNKFLEQLSNFRVIIKEFYSSDKQNEISEFQNKHLIYYENTYRAKEKNLRGMLNRLYLRMINFFKHNDKNDFTNIELFNFKNISESYLECKSKDDYMKLLDEIIDISKDEPYTDYVNVGYSFIRFILSIKIEDKKLFNEKYKYLDRSIGTLLSQNGVKKELSIYIDILEGKSDLEECIKLIKDYFKSYQL